MRTMDGNLNKRQFYPYTIYTSKNHKYHAKNLIFYKTEQKGLSFETFREISTFFAKMQKIPYTIYTNQNHEYHTENLIFYSIEQKGLFTDNGRRTPPPQSAPMGSRLTSFLLSVKACGSSQGESRQDVIFWQKSADLRSESVSKSPGWKYAPEVVKVDESVPN